ATTSRSPSATWAPWTSSASSRPRSPWSPRTTAISPPRAASASAPASSRAPTSMARGRARTSRRSRTGTSSRVTSSISPTSWGAERTARGSRLLDDLIRPAQQRLGQSEAEGPGRLQVDGEIELGRLLHGQIRGLRALEDLVHGGGGAPIVVGKARAVGEHRHGRRGHDERWARRLDAGDRTRAHDGARQLDLAEVGHAV